ncbi:acyltransferase family protein [Caenimonas sedimenti]|uniref:Acyltransferase family protein n=1 Tax=Caenimonas sedimenti TaxID=2596921 RepID=A0A562ZKZ0_9BURK|nr:acyltransferase family protein [Caenimonas sedimenti]TWO68978.1 acyltransferase family protein [Caenimonas sedimenti]
METQGPARLHALDNLRALMMWLGVVLHVALIHTVHANPLPWRDPQRTIVADIAWTAIHTFRMPAFFILAGFFVMMLLQSRGPKGLAEHRLARLGAPIVVFWLPIVMACGLFAALYMHRMVRGTWGIDMSLVTPPPGVPVGPNLLHLWFVWMLLWMSLGTAVLAQFEGLRPLFTAAGAFLRRLATSWWGVLVLALPLQGAGWAYPNGILVSSGLFLPPFAEWLHYGTFFAFGAAAYTWRAELFPVWERRWWVFAGLGLAAYLAAGAMMERRSPASDLAFVQGCASWLWSFAAIGAALRFLPASNKVLAYLSDSSYWVYILHLPLTIAFGCALYALELPGLLKIALNIAATTVVCLVTYELWVRSTWVGELLNGRRRPSRFGPTPQGLATR